MELSLPVIDLRESLEEMSLPSPEEYDYWVGRKNRIFYVDYDIDENYGVIELSKAIFQMNIEEMNIPEDELKPIIIMIHSFGGDVFQANYFADLLIASRIPIYTVAMGSAMSGGFHIFLAGHKRFVFEHSQLMVHKGYGGFEGTADEIEQFQKNYKKLQDEMKEYILSRTDIDVKVFNKNRSKDWYLTKDEIEKYNVAKVIKNITEIFE